MLQGVWMGVGTSLPPGGPQGAIVAVRAAFILGHRQYESQEGAAPGSAPRSEGVRIPGRRQSTCSRRCHRRLFFLGVLGDVGLSIRCYCSNGNLASDLQLPPEPVRHAILRFGPLWRIVVKLCALSDVGPQSPGHGERGAAAILGHANFPWLP